MDANVAVLLLRGDRESTLQSMRELEIGIEELLLLVLLLIVAAGGDGEAVAGGAGGRAHGSSASTSRVPSCTALEFE